jgi:hypothetical protein
MRIYKWCKEQNGLFGVIWLRGGEFRNTKQH